MLYIIASLRDNISFITLTCVIERNTHTRQFNGHFSEHVHYLGPDSQTILGQTYDISYDNIL